MIENLILLLGLICAVVVQIVKVKEKRSYLIMVLQAVAIVLPIIGNPSLGFYFLGLTSIITMIFFIVESGGLKKWQSTLFFIPLILVFLFSGLNLPGANILKLSMLLPIFVFGILLFQSSRPYKSISNMLVFVVFAVIELLKFI